jgi:hypothetical protein
MSRSGFAKAGADALFGSDEFRRLAAGFNQFCPFEATGMVRAEIRHGYFLSYMLDPRRPHGFADRVTSAFLQAALEQSSDAIDKMLGVNGGSLQVRREWRRIDLLVVLPVSKLVVAVELKIDAFQSDRQLADYRATVEREWPVRQGWNHKFIFLTKRAEVSNDNWDDLPMVSLVTRLEGCVTGDETAPGAGMLRDYVRMMRTHHVGNDLTIELARKLWSEHGEVLDFLVRNRPMPIRELFNSLKDAAESMAETASTPTMLIQEDDHAPSIIRFGIKEWDSLKSFMTAADWTTSARLILLELKPTVGGIDAFAYIAPSKDSARKRYAAKLAKAGLVPKTVAEGEGWGLLAKAELFRAVDVLGFEQEDAFNAVTHSFSQFAARIYESFNPVLRS